jgi:AcrR family transcriptional regulator
LINKAFDDISVQEIADEATLNRATFYLHYPDKNALLQAMTESRFRNLIERRGIIFTDCNGTLRAIALGVCDYLAETTGCPTQLARISLEGSIIPVVKGMFKEGLALHGTAPGADAALLATTAAWAVFRRRTTVLPDSKPYSRRRGGGEDRNNDESNSFRHPSVTNTVSPCDPALW